MKRLPTILLGACALLALPKATVATAAPPATSPLDRDTRIAWWRDARFGLFSHWGIMSIPGKDCFVMDQERIPVAEYEKLVARFNPVEWNPEAVVRAAKQAGQRYLVFVAKHHDGFCMWDTRTTPYNVMQSPYRRDIVRGLADECHKQGIVFCFYYSILDWHHPDAKGDRWPKYVDYMKAQLTELLTNYGPIGAVWFDGEWAPEWTDAQGRELAAFVWAHQPKTLINNRVGRIRQEKDPVLKAQCFAADFATPEQEIPPNGLPGVDWESCMTMNNSWSWNSSDTSYKSERACIELLIDTASKGGNLLLNVGPQPDGRIPEPQQQRLAAIQKWMATNQESIHGTTASPFPQSFPWGRCTAKQLTPTTRRLYLHVFDSPAAGEISVPTPKSPAKIAYALSDKNRTPLKLTANDKQTTIHLPQQFTTEHDFVIVLETQRQPNPPTSK